MAYDIDNYASLGLLWKCLSLQSPDAPSSADRAAVVATLAEALADIGNETTHDLSTRFNAEHRRASQQVRALLRRQWSSAGA
jgi:malonate decarboxylase gamma subunit